MSAAKGDLFLLAPSDDCRVGYLLPAIVTRVKKSRVTGVRYQDGTRETRTDEGGDTFTGFTIRQDDLDRPAEEVLKALPAAIKDIEAAQCALFPYIEKTCRKCGARWRPERVEEGSRSFCVGCRIS